MQQRYCYLRVQLVTSSEEEVTELAARVAADRALKAACGAAGAARPLDVLRAGGAGAAVLRAPATDLRRLRAALALDPALRVTGAASSLAASADGVRRLEAGGGKDVVLVAAPARLAEPSAVVLPERAEEPGGLLRPDGSINWGCPCLGGMAAGPCGDQFREAFSCFHYSEAEPKGSECYEKFSVMQECMARYPELYGKDDDDDAAGAAGAPGTQGAPGAEGAPPAPAGDTAG